MLDYVISAEAVSPNIVISPDREDQLADYMWQIVYVTSGDFDVISRVEEFGRSGEGLSDQ